MSGQLVIPPLFLSASSFSEGLASVETAQGFGYINAKGQYAIPPQFAYAGDFSDGLALVIPFLESKGHLVNPDLPLWGTPSGKYFARTRRDPVQPRDSF